jgi:hypothetical protein
MTASLPRMLCDYAGLYRAAASAQYHQSRWNSGRPGPWADLVDDSLGADDVFGLGPSRLEGVSAPDREPVTLPSIAPGSVGHDQGGDYRSRPRWSARSCGCCAHQALPKAVPKAVAGDEQSRLKKVRFETESRTVENSADRAVWSGVSIRVPTLVTQAAHPGSCLTSDHCAIKRHEKAIKEA